MNKKIVIGLLILIVLTATSLLFIKSEETTVLEGISQSAAVINVSTTPVQKTSHFTCWLFGGEWRQYQGYRKVTWDCDWTPELAPGRVVNPAIK